MHTLLLVGANAHADAPNPASCPNQSCSYYHQGFGGTLLLILVALAIVVAVVVAIGLCLVWILRRRRARRHIERS